MCYISYAMTEEFSINYESEANRKRLEYYHFCIFLILGLAHTLLFLYLIFGILIFIASMNLRDDDSSWPAVHNNFGLLLIMQFLTLFALWYPMLLKYVLNPFFKSLAEKQQRQRRKLDFQERPTL